METVNRRTVLGGAVAAAAGIVWGGTGRAAAAPRPVPASPPDLIALRRDLHAHPEAPGQEARTAAVVAGRLRAAGLAVTTDVGGHGVVAVLHGTRPGRTVAYRADMDAVPPQDIVGGGTAPAHLCGHDLHTTVAVGVAEALARQRHRHGLSGNVVFLFQPAEEALAGARALLDAGVLERHGVEEIHALHCGPFPVGQFAVTPGYGLPGQDRGEIQLTGAGAADAADAARRLAAEIAALATVTPPQTPAELERMVADVQTPNGPLARFVAVRARAEDATVRVSFRCWPQERYVEIREHIRRLAGAYAGASVTFSAAPFPAMVCPEPEARALARHLRGTLGRQAVTELHAAFPFNGEDFALYLDRVPGTYTFLGVRTPGAPITTAYPHYPGFTPDERAIGAGVRAMTGWIAERVTGGSCR
ncbi:amidohydrolase [Streptomyces sp. NPDC049555]|uniref:M20 metallopeptidase family protein n=1 Tax=Streptomyces sp. NPDC049555 TaxID=3154930 RepID=UPI0034127862